MLSSCKPSERPRRKARPHLLGTPHPCAPIACSKTASHSDLNLQGCSCVPLLSSSPNQYSIHSQTAQQPNITLQCFQPQGIVRRSIRRFIIALYLGPCTLCACKALYKTPLLTAQRAAGTRSCFQGAVCIPPAGFRDSPTRHIDCQQTSPVKMANSSLSEGAGSTQEQLSFGAQPPASAASSLTKQNSEVHLKTPRAAGGDAIAHCRPHFSSVPPSGSSAPPEPFLRMHRPQSNSTSMSPNRSWQDSLQLWGGTGTRLRRRQAAELFAHPNPSGRMLSTQPSPSLPAAPAPRRRTIFITRNTTLGFPERFWFGGAHVPA